MNALNRGRKKEVTLFVDTEIIKKGTDDIFLDELKFG